MLTALLSAILGTILLMLTFQSRIWYKLGQLDRDVKECLRYHRAHSDGHNDTPS